MVHRLENLNVIASLGTIMRINTAYYLTCFIIDAEIMRKWLQKAVNEPTPLLWNSHPRGTHFLSHSEEELWGMLKQERCERQFLLFGLFAFISKDEPRDQPVRLPKPPIIKKLESNRITTTPPAVKRDALER